MEKSSRLFYFFFRIFLIFLLSFAFRLSPFALSAQSLDWIDQDAALRAKSLKSAQYGRTLESSRGSSPTDIDIKFHRILLSLDPAVRYVSGSVSTYFVPITDNLREIVFDLADSLQVTAVRYHGELISSYSRGSNQLRISLGNDGRPPTDDRRTTDDGRPTSVIGHPSSVGLDSIMVDYNGVPPDNGSGSFTVDKHEGVPVLYTLSEPYGAMDWWPCRQDLNDKIDSVHLVITVPAGYRAAANGMLIREQHCDDRSIYQWMHRHPIAAYLVGVAVTNYAVYSDYVSLANIGRTDSIEILNYVYPETLTQTRAQTLQLLQPFQLFNQLFGVYPFANERYGHAQWNWGGGMEHQTMSFMGSFGYDLMAHELAHQWFGDFITCGSWRDIWLNEGFATYLTGLCYERDQGGLYWEPFKRLSISRIIKQPGGSVYCYDTTNADRIFDARLSYSKGAMVLHMLRWEMGDGNFFKALNNYMYDPALANGYARTDDLIRHCEAVSDTSFREFFNDWVYGEGYPTYSLIYRRGEGTSLEIEVTQETSHPSVGFFEMHLPVRLFWGGVPAFAGMTSAPGELGTSVIPANAGISRNSASREGVPAFAGMKSAPGELGASVIPAKAGIPRNSASREGIPAFAGMTGGERIAPHYQEVVLHHTANHQVFTLDPGFVVDSVQFDPERWICTANAVVLNVESEWWNKDVKVYPNPVSDRLLIECPATGSEIRVALYDMTGKKVAEKRFPPTSGLIEFQVGEFQEGVYGVEVVTSTSSMHRKVLINR